MPPRKVNTPQNVKKTPKVKRVAAKGFKLPDPISPGQILTDVTRHQWKLGKSIGQGGFGEIYSASNIIDRPVSDDAAFVIKVEPHSNGPLFTEMHCYMRIAKPENIEAWKISRKLKNLGMPKYFGSGSHEYKGQKYRFMVMERFGSDVQKIIEKYKKRFSYKTVIQIATQVLDVLEYIHSYEYIHADVKASNLLVGHQRGTENQVYLVDYGLACRYMIDGKHKEYKYDQRKAHDGTIEFTSRDAHIGANSRRGDLEILGYNMVQWLCGKLPWEDNLQDCEYVASQKRALMGSVPKFMKLCFPEGVPPGIQEFLEYVASLTFDETPNYEKCRNILRNGLKRKGQKDDGKLVFLPSTPKAASRMPLAGTKKPLKRPVDAENIGVTPRIKHFKGSGRSPCKPRNQNSRASTRSGQKESPRGVLLRNQVEYDIECEKQLIQKENEKMLARQRKERPKKLPVKTLAILENPTPQMLEIMAKIREKSTSPTACNKKHKHNGICQPMNKLSPISEVGGSALTPEMKAIMKKRSGRRDSSGSELSCGPSPDMFDSDNEVNDTNDDTVYYSPCGGPSSGDHCSHHKSKATPRPRTTVKTAKRCSFGTKRRGNSSRNFGKDVKAVIGKKKSGTSKLAVFSGRVTRSSKNTSPEVV